ncbi:alpha/beta fold hydrolase [Acaryochloris sp. IP29b_bin.148]|uniref:alpha/beta fold hydrolase n=1 Tax=Acaryochloris sp. IP29b_bin.148 TaxID=2969218 RepID=UPI0026130457|nr:alpha/beta fold hydrolase [Acaryochloris sp. IP29b_bin.148]
MAPYSGQAVVIGGSISGLLSARILADHFEQVLILERDITPEDPVPRKGVPQSFHGHVLLAQGVKILDQLFPGFCEQLKARGAAEIDLLADYLAQTDGDAWLPRFHSGIYTYGCTRSLIETLIRERLCEFPQVQFEDKQQVLGLKGDPSRKAVIAVNSRSRSGLDQQVPAQLVVDASGRGSKAPQWLQTIGYDKPEEIKIDPLLTYGSRVYQVPDNFEHDWKGILLGAQGADNPRSAILVAVEDNRWLVTFGGYGEVQPAQEEEGFLDFARKLRSPVLYEALMVAKPLTPIYRYKGTVNRRRYFEKLSRWPENFIVIGDAACAFNPTHGKGITNAALSALCLNQTLESYSPQTLQGFSFKFQKQLAKVNEETWSEVLDRDSHLHTVQHKPSFLSLNQLLRPYLLEVFGAAQSNPKVFQKVLEILHQLQPKTSLFEQDLLLEVAKQAVIPKSLRKITKKDHTIPKRLHSKQELEQTLHHRYIYTNGIRLHYVTQGEGPLVVLLHGFPEFWYSWRHQIPELAQNFKVVALDLRGYNDSDKPKDAKAYHITELMKDVQGVIKGLGYDHCILAGHDWGGAIAWNFAHRYPEMVEKLVVMNMPHPAAFSKALTSNPQQMLKSWYIPFFQLPVIPELLMQAEDYRAITSTFSDGVSNKHAFSPQDIEIFKDAVAKRGALTAMLNYYRCNSDLFQQDWKRLDIPTLMLWGIDDAVLGKELTFSTKNYVSHLQIKYLENCSHWTQQEQPELVNRYMKKFLLSEDGHNNASVGKPLVAAGFPS